MSRNFNKYQYLLFLFIAVLLFQTCKTDEFKLDKITIKEDWGIKVISPVFTGKEMEFRDFIYNWYKPVPNLPGDKTVLDYINTSDKTIPTQLIFDPSAVIDSFPFYIQGAYSLAEVELEFTVKNGSPFPLNLQLQFFNRAYPNKMGPPILPKPFREADFTQSSITPVLSKQSVRLDSLQMQSFTNGDRIKFSSWFDSTSFIDQNDTLSAHYPIDVSIVLIGIVQGTK